MEWSTVLDLLGNMFSNDLLGNIWLIGIATLGIFAFFMWKSGAGIEITIVIIAPLVLLMSFYGYLPAMLGWAVLLVLAAIFGLFMWQLFGRS